MAASEACWAMILTLAPLVLHGNHYQLHRPWTHLPSAPQWRTAKLWRHPSTSEAGSPGRAAADWGAGWSPSGCFPSAGLKPLPMDTSVWKLALIDTGRLSTNKVLKGHKTTVLSVFFFLWMTLRLSGLAFVFYKQRKGDIFVILGSG